MKVVMLSGAPNSGKTTVLNDLYDHLIKAGAFVQAAKAQLGGNPLDFECILNVKGKHVAIYTMGDYKEYCYKAVIKYALCDTLVLAYSDKFQNSIAAFLLSIPGHVVIPKSIGTATIVNSADVTAISNNI